MTSKDLIATINEALSGDVDDNADERADVLNGIVDMLENGGLFVADELFDDEPAPVEGVEWCATHATIIDELNGNRCEAKHFTSTPCLYTPLYTVPVGGDTTVIEWYVNQLTEAGHTLAFHNGEMGDTAYAALFDVLDETWTGENSEIYTSRLVEAYAEIGSLKASLGDRVVTWDGRGHTAAVIGELLPPGCYTQFTGELMDNYGPESYYDRQEPLQIFWKVRHRDPTEVWGVVPIGCRIRFGDSFAVLPPEQET